MEEKWPSNNVELCGTLGGKPQYSHKSRNEKYYVFPLEIERLSETIDIINIVVRESVLYSVILEECEKIIVKGELRSFNNKSGIGNKLIITVFAKKIEMGYGEDRNEVLMCGVICKPLNLRKTPMGREICDMMLAVNRRYGRSDYIPCIAWGLNAEKASLWDVGYIVQLTGRIQSRKYIKVIGNEALEKTVFEVSAITIDAVPEDGVTD